MLNVECSPSRSRRPFPHTENFHHVGMREHDIRVETGRFGAEMAVELVNDGPFTIWLDTDDR